MKAASHNNENVSKCCIKNFLQAGGPIDLFKSLIYEQLVPILNRSRFYKGATMDVDSKFIHVISEYFTVGISKLEKV